MPRIDPLQLLNTLGVLLSPTGGINSKEEVQRLAELMRKFSKKLVSKCIYVQILSATPEELLQAFLESNGWQLMRDWLKEAYENNNWTFVLEILKLLEKCPVATDKLRDDDPNSAPQIVDKVRLEAELAEVRRQAAIVHAKWEAMIEDEEEEDMESEDDEEQLPSLKLTLKVASPMAKEEKSTSSSSISLLQSLAEEVNEELKKDAQKKAEEKNDSTKASKTTVTKDLTTSGTKRHVVSPKSSSASSSVPAAPLERKRFRPDRRDEIDPQERQRIKDIARKLREDHQAKKDKETLKKIGVGLGSSGPTLSKIPKIPKKNSSSNSGSDEKSKNGSKSFEAMLGNLDSSKPKTVKTPLNKNKTASMLAGMKSSEKGGRPEARHHSRSSSSRSHRSHDAGSRSSSSRSKESSSKDRHESSRRREDRRPSDLSSLKRSNSSSESKSSSSNSSSKSGSESSKSSSPSVKYSESAGFINALVDSMRGPTGGDSSRRKKRRGSNDEANKINGFNNGKRSSDKKENKEEGNKDKKGDEASKGSNDIEGKEATSTFSFYRDTLEEPSTESVSSISTRSKRRRLEEAEEHNHVQEMKEDIKMDTKTSDQDEKKDESMAMEANESSVSTMDTFPREVKGILILHQGTEKRSRRITWQPESRLVAVRYFEMDEDERVNVNKIKFERMRDIETKMEKAAFQNIKEDPFGISLDQDGSNRPPQFVPNCPRVDWYTPMALSLDEKNAGAEAGKESTERRTQEERERNVLQALYFREELTPPTPTEPDGQDAFVSRLAPDTAVVVPLTDEEGDGIKDFSHGDWNNITGLNSPEEVEDDDVVFIDHRIRNEDNRTDDRESGISNLNHLTPALQGILSHVAMFNQTKSQPKPSAPSDQYSASSESLAAPSTVPSELPTESSSSSSSSSSALTQDELRTLEAQREAMKAFNIQPPVGSSTSSSMTSASRPPNVRATSSPPMRAPPATRPPFEESGFQQPPPGMVVPPPRRPPPPSAQRPPNFAPNFPPPFMNGPPPGPRQGPPPFRGGRGRFSGRGGGGPRGFHRDFRPRTPCMFFAKGACREGDRCTFLHETTADRSMS